MGRSAAIARATDPVRSQQPEARKDKCGSRQRGPAKPQPGTHRVRIVPSPGMISLVGQGRQSHWDYMPNTKILPTANGRFAVLARRTAHSELHQVGVYAVELDAKAYADLLDGNTLEVRSDVISEWAGEDWGADTAII
jgi:hypothetical protein